MIMTREQRVPASQLLTERPIERSPTDRTPTRFVMALPHGMLPSPATFWPREEMGIDFANTFEISGASRPLAPSRQAAGYPTA